ncbi:MAG: dihydroorotase [Lachnospiraceae bacterium]|mgnify:FL=1|nr:dihydroorotase [Lachnospiraceae bacterium]
MMLIENGMVIDPANGIKKQASILIKEGKIAKIIENQQELDALQINSCDRINALGCIVAPGLVDVHVHFRDPGFTHKEDIETGAKAALRGGFTSVVLMANTNPVVDNAETLTYVLEKGKKTDLKVYTCATVTKGMSGKELTDMELLFAKGAVGFTDDGKPILDTMILEQALKKAAALKVPVSLHEENPAYIQNNGVNAGTAAEYFKIAGSPREAEISMIERDLQIALETGAILNIQHISTKEGVALVREAKRKAAELGFNNIHAEATPHHFSLTQDAVLAYGTLAKMNPPLREEADRQAVIEGLKDGTIDMIATDHAPHSEEEKARSITEAPSGIVGLETALALGITNLVDTGYLSIEILIERMSTAPARLYKLSAGTLSEGAPADLVIFNMGASWTVETFLSKSSNSPFVGQTLKGMVKYTIVDGKVVYTNL